MGEELDIKALSLHKGESGVYHFDFSLISKSIYRQFMTQLKFFAQSSIISLGFCADGIREQSKNKIFGSSKFVIPNDSIASQSRSYILNTVELLCFLLSKETRIRELYLSSIAFSDEQIIRIAEALPRSKIEKLSLMYIPLKQSGLDALLSKIDPNRLNQISLLNCSLNSSSTQCILDFINRKSSPLTGIKVFEVSSLEFTEEDRNLIYKALNPNSQPTESMSSKKYEQEIQKLRIENANLKRELLVLQSSIKAVPFDNDVYLVGHGAKEFADFLNKIEANINDLSQ